MIEDNRKNTKNPLVWVCATDSYMSGWGLAPGKSYIAFACHNRQEAEAVEIALRKRPEMQRVRVNISLPRVSKSDHLSVNDKMYAPEYYKGAAAFGQ